MAAIIGKTFPSRSMNRLIISGVIASIFIPIFPLYFQEIEDDVGKHLPLSIPKVNSHTGLDLVVVEAT